MITSTRAIVEPRAPSELLDGAIASFLTELQTAGYTKESVRNKRTVIRKFVDWLRRRHLTSEAIAESQIAAFLPRPRAPRPRSSYKHAALSGFLRYLRRVGLTPFPPRAAALGDDLIQQYIEHLRRDRGLADNTVLWHVPCIREWLRHQAARTGNTATDAFDASMIEDFLVDQTRKRSRASVELLAAALRSFLRFLFLRGYRSTDLSTAVPRVCRARPTIPAFLSPEQVDRVLAATDRSTSVGRRDYAIVLLLARLGLRAGEVAHLELEDIVWRTGELVIRGKNRRVENLPLLADVGEALAQYLRTGRPASASRRVFLRALPPHGGLSGPSVIGDIVSRRLADADVPRSGRGAAHLFRHGLATHMIRHGASLAEIAQVLRHRSPSTTALYTHLSFEALRAVARPWPTGGDQ